MTVAADLSLPEAYARWQALLAEEFFGGRRDQAVVMFVDRSELDQLTAPGEDGPRSLASAVRALVDVSSGRSMFNLACAAERQWATGSRSIPPPTLPILALTVLAASEMRRDAEGASHNYYIRLASVLLPDAGEPEVDELRHNLREGGAFQDVVTLWRGIDEWLDEQAGAFGLSTIPEVSGHYSRIGYPLSQTLVRRSDRAALTRFFDRMDLTHAGIPEPPALLSLLKLWIRTRAQGFSERFLQSLGDAGLGEVIAPLIHSLARAWDGVIVTTDGLRRLEFRLTIDIDRRESWWVIPAVKDAPDDILIIDDQPQELLITLGRAAKFYEVEGLPAVTSDALHHGFVGRGTNCVAEYRPAELLVFIDDAGAGGWLSVEAAQAYEEHVFAARPSLSDDLQAVLQRGADSGWVRLRSDFAGQVLPGYAIYYGITFSDEQRFKEALGQLGGRVADSFRFGAAARPRLINGLPLFRDLSRSAYLEGGEPDLELPLGAGIREVPVTLDEQTCQTFQASGFPIPLSVRAGGYSLGVHTLAADGETLRFEVSRGAGPGWEPPGVGSLGWLNGRVQDSSPGGVCGAVTATGPGRPDALIRRGAQHNWLISHQGQLMEISEPPAPNFLPSASFGYFDVALDGGCWLLQQRVRSWEIIRLRPQGPQFRNLSPEDHRIWEQAARAVQTDDALWRLYLEAWGHIRGH